jgi:hypothetical protein
MAPRDQDHGGAFHRVKGRVMRLLGWATADRRVEAEGEAEARAGRPPTPREADRAEHEVKASYGESTEPAVDVRRRPER